MRAANDSRYKKPIQWARHIYGSFLGFTLMSIALIVLMVLLDAK
jgi:hypothetical protein